MSGKSDACFGKFHLLHYIDKSMWSPREHRGRQLATDVDFRLGQQCIKSFMEWVFMAKQLKPSDTSPRAMQSVGYNGVKLWFSTGVV